MINAERQWTDLQGGGCNFEDEASVWSLTGNNTNLCSYLTQRISKDGYAVVLWALMTCFCVFQVPSRKHLTSTLIPQRDSNITSNIMKMLAKTRSVCLTLDLWTNRQTRGYLGVTAHFMNDWTLVSTMLSCHRFTGRHTGWFVPLSIKSPKLWLIMAAIKPI